MSYDLLFLKKLGSPPVTAAMLAEHFRERPHYNENEEQFFYENEDTGVYFSFDITESANTAFDDDDEIEPIDDGLEPVNLSFNLNYFRPHYFALEAELELSALVDRFSLLVDDPQNEGMGRGPYSREGFLKSWNAGNLFGHYAYLSRMAEGDDPISLPPALPRAMLEPMWRWNFQHARLQETLGEDVYVPPIRLIHGKGRAQRFVVWGDAIPQAVPEVDILVLVRDELAPRRLFTRKRDMCLVEYESVRPLFRHAQHVDEDVPYHLFRYDVPPSEVVDLFRSADPSTDQLEGIAYDGILTEETVDEAKTRMSRRRPE